MLGPRRVLLSSPDIDIMPLHMWAHSSRACPKSESLGRKRTRARAAVAVLSSRTVSARVWATRPCHSRGHPLAHRCIRCVAPRVPPHHARLPKQGAAQQAMSCHQAMTASTRVCGKQAVLGATALSDSAVASPSTHQPKPAQLNVPREKSVPGAEPAVQTVRCCRVFQKPWVSLITLRVYSLSIAFSSSANVFFGLPSTVLYKRSHSRIVLT